MATKKPTGGTKKTVSTAKKTAATKTIKKIVKKPASKGAKKGSKYSCKVCGLVVSVDKECGCTETCDLICCGKQMTAKK